MFKKKLKVISLLLAFILFNPIVKSQDFPYKPVRIIVPFAPGGVSDILGRVLAEKLTLLWKQPVIIENRSGAGGSLGADMVLKSTADGHTLLISDASVATTNPMLYPSAPKDFSCVISLARFGQILVSPAKSHINSIHDLLKTDKSKLALLNVASSGNGTSNHLVLEKFKASAKINMTHVPYKGAGQAIADLAGGQVDLMFTSAPLAQPLISIGKLKALAVTASNRMIGFEQIPILNEAGLEGFEWISAQGLFAPTGTPAFILKKINSDISKIIMSSEMREKWIKMGLEFSENSPEQFSAWIHDETVAIKALILSGNIKLD